MHNIKLTLEYDGTRYQGWQRPGKRENTNTVSGRMTETLRRMTGENIELFCGARTEAGVHAAGQTVNFKTDCTMSPREIKSYLNHYLPQDIVILSAQEVPERFHAGLNVRSQTYLYRIMTGPVSDVFCRNYTYYLPQMPDIDAMNQAAATLLGKHDFQNFSSGKKKKAAEKELFSIQISAQPKADLFRLPNAPFSEQHLHNTVDSLPKPNNNTVSSSIQELQILLTGSSFLHQMPRMIIATLLDIGYGKRNPDCIGCIFSGRELPSAPCPPRGLCLLDISYS